MRKVSALIELAFKRASFVLNSVSVKLKISKGAPLLKKLIRPVAPDR